MSIQTELCSLKQQHKLLKVETVLKWAEKHPESKLHAALEWNDGKAAHEFRLIQVTRLIQIHLIDVEGTRTVVSLSIDRARGGGYRAMSEVLGDKRLREVLLADALADLQRFEERYKLLKELVSGIRRLRKRAEVTTKKKAA